MTDLTAAETHFEFGKNWRSYAAQLNEAQIAEAVAGLRRLLRLDSLEGKTFLDIGCGSGVHALAAPRLGATRVLAMDIDADSVATTRALLNEHAPGSPVTVRQASILDADGVGPERFDVVYSWGVLHHTGRMHAAMQRAAALVADNALFAFALYRKTWCCPLWKIEKRWYTGASEPWRRRARSVYLGLHGLSLLLKGQRLRDHMRNYAIGNRGMDFLHDVHDWLGGFPYESISSGEVEAFMRGLGFGQVASNVRLDLRSRSGLLGSGCDEYLYRRSSAGDRAL